jgi:hypothetical protein
VNLTGKTVNISQLDAELTAAGVDHRGLGTDGDRLYTYDEAGVEVDDLPAGAQAVIDAHVPVPLLTRDERLLAAVDTAKAAVGAGAFTPTQAATLQAVFDGLGAAITGGATP